MERLQKVIANSGYCSRRKAEEEITKGHVTVNGQIITELGTKVNVSDVCLLLGGGGHPKAAGCFVSGTLEQAKSKVLNAIKQEMK